LVKEVFNRQTFAASTYVSEGDTLGMVLILADLNLVENELVRDYLRMLDLAYRRNVALKDRHTLDIYDSATGIFNRRHFSKLIDEEIARSRRLLLPVSLIFINVDRIRLFNEKIGAKQADAVLKIIALIFKRTARVNDAVARLGGDEFAFLLPHTPSSGATLKAERLRRIIESTKFPLLENSQLGPVTVSLGVSEYPSLCSDSESLLRSADEAMQQVKVAGGNKVCLSTPASGFQMDFTPLKMPSSSRASRAAQTSSKVFGGSQ
jgi:diguanylate cyclase (GGDEF)-like protein